MKLQELKQHIRDLAMRLPNPDNQFPAFDGLPGEPGGILIQRRSEQLKINQGKNLLQLFHRRFVLTVALETEGLTCVNDVTFPIAPDYAALVYPFQYHHYMVDQSNFFWIVITFELDRVFYPEHLYHCSIRISENSYALLARMLELYLGPDGAADPRLRRYLNCLIAELDMEPSRINVGPHVPAEDLRIRLFEEINGYICRYIADPSLSVERIARKYRVSKSYLYAIFEKDAPLSSGGIHPAVEIEAGHAITVKRAVFPLRSGIAVRIHLPCDVLSVFPAGNGNDPGGIYPQSCPVDRNHVSAGKGKYGWQSTRPLSVRAYLLIMEML